MIPVDHDNELLGFTIYCQPTDFPWHYVVRPWKAVRGLPEPVHYHVGCLCQSLEEARAMIPEFMTVMARHPTDQPQIVESYL